MYCHIDAKMHLLCIVYRQNNIEYNYSITA
jgi:hypothetical protein